jgi:DtxR family Mn-dependent transcriptional regulator
MYSISQGDYLRAIYNICESGCKKEVDSVELAESLGFSKAAVSNMLKKMNDEGLVKMKPYSSFSLTAKGLREAEKLTYKHRVIEVFLVDRLKIKKEKVHQEAHQLEHALSDEVIRKLDNFLGNPKVCPDGKQIPKINK